VPGDEKLDGTAAHRPLAGGGLRSPGMERAGRYRLTRRLGQGGMAEVLEGIAEGESGFRRRVAVKRILPALADDAACARMFLDEARIASHLHHASIVSVLDYGTLDGVPFQVLEFVDGLDLERLARLAEERGTRLSTGLALYIATQVAYALDHAHRARDESGAPLGIVHRDVSPANVLVSWDGHVKLGDFGIAIAENRLERTQNDGIKGKLEYMSPEQATRGAVDARSDVFALGCTLHRLLAGQSPLSDLGALTRVISGEELALDTELPGDIAAVIRKATRAARVERQGSAAELARELGELTARHLAGDATFALRSYLAELRTPAGEKPRRGALDALLDLELVLSTDGEERAYTSRHAVASATTAPESAARVAAAPDAVPPRRSPWVLAVLALAAGGVAIALWPSPSKVNAPPTPPAAAPARAVLPPSTLPEAQPPVPAAAEPHAVEPAPEARRTSPRPRASATSRSEVAPATAPSVPSGRGTLVIGGARAHRAEILVDGRPQGHAPRRLELPAGPHEVVLVRPDGTRIGPHRVEVGARHTPSSPARWIVE
jgi:serine/threonine protein kinase